MTTPHAHLFALHYANLKDRVAAWSIGQSYTIADKMLASRVGKILRLRPGERLTLFDETVSANVVLELVCRDELRLLCECVDQYTMVTPAITLGVGLLKKGSFEEVAYAAAQLGVRHLVPLVTEKSRHEWYGRELERLHAVMVAAREQSKSFSEPKIGDLTPLAEFVRQAAGEKLYFETNGQPLGLITKRTRPDVATVLVGPEGGFTDDEIALLIAQSFAGYQLTATVLRATDAVLVGTGALLSIWR